VRTRFTPAGREAFRRIIENIRRNNPQAARGFHERIARALRMLAQFPESGRVIPEFRSLGYREVIVVPYRVFYRIEGETVWIAGIWHGAQRPDAPEQ